MTTARLRLADENIKRPAFRTAFTVKGLSGIIPPPKGRIQVMDDKQAGLMLRLTSNGHRAYYLYRKIQGQPVRIKLGDFNAISIEQARRMAAKMLGDIANGINPAHERRKAKTAHCLDEAFKGYLEQYAKPFKRTWRADAWQYEKYLSRWSSRRLDSITRMDIEALHQRIGKDSPIGANRLLALLSKFFSWAGEHGFEGINPAKGIHRFKESARARYMDGDELGRFLLALEDAPNRLSADCLMALLLTGARLSNVQSMRFDEIDFTRKVWTIPPEKFKTNHAHEIPLTDAMMALLARRRMVDADSPWVFTRHRSNGNQPMPITNVRVTFESVCQRAGIVGLRLHDLRRTTASMATTIGVNYATVKAMLGHSTGDITGIYARPTPDAIRQAFERTTTAILSSKPTT